MLRTPLRAVGGRILALALVLGLAAPGGLPAFAAHGPVGSEIQVNTTTASDQDTPAVAVDANGNFVVAWESANQDGSQDGVYARLFAVSGAPLTGEIQVNTTTADFQERPAVAMDGNGNFVVAWESANQDGSADGVYARLFNAAGVALTGEIQVNTTTASVQTEPAVAMDDDGDFVVAWASFNQDAPNTYGIFARRFDASGAPVTGELAVNTTTAGEQLNPAVAMDADGDFVVAWEGNGPGDVFGVFARRFAASGAAVTGEIAVNTYTLITQDDPAVAMDDDGDFVVAWKSLNQDGSVEGVYARRFDAGGAAVTAEIAVNTTTANAQFVPAVAMDADGDFVVAWASNGQDGSGDGVYARRFNASGAALTGELAANITTADDQELPAVAIDVDGNAVIAWESFGQDGSGEGVYARRFHFNDPPPAGTPLCFGQAATIVGTAGNDVITGTAGNDVIVGLGGSDTINGRGGNDRICAGAGNDSVLGGAGNDLINGEAGNDTVLGGPGNDVILGGAGNDILRGGNGVDRLYGEQGDDRLFGDDGDDVLAGHAGNDRLFGGIDNDTLRGGPGVDLLRGEDGDDTLDGGASLDNCDGGAGAADTAAACEVTFGIP